MIVAIPLMLSIIATSNGITFFLHHCHCENRLLVSITQKIICEEDHQHELLSSCCSVDDNVIRIDSETESCGCENESITLKLVDANSYNAFSVSAGDFMVASISGQNVPVANLLITANFGNFESPPPAVWGRKLVTLYHCAKNPEHIS